MLQALRNKILHQDGIVDLGRNAAIGGHQESLDSDRILHPCASLLPMSQITIDRQPTKRGSPS